MSATTTIRFAGPDDAEAIHAMIVELAIFEREPDAVQATPAGLRQQLASERPPFECLLAEVDDTAAGFALFYTSYSTWLGQPGIYLEDLYVAPGQRRRGLGRTLLAHLARLAAERGCGRLEWAVLDWNQPAIDFYQTLAAAPQDEWTTFRLTGDALRRLAGEEPL